MDEIIIGAILTQNVNWKNVEKALLNLKEQKMCSLTAIHLADEKAIALAIKPSLYFNQKAKRLKSFTNYLYADWKGDIKSLFAEDWRLIRNNLLKLNGFGAETVDSILLYAAQKPVFVIDSYTKRIFLNLSHIEKDMNYDDIQSYFMQNLENDVELFQDYHAQIVSCAKIFCHLRKPQCSICVLKGCCSKNDG